MGISLLKQLALPANSQLQRRGQRVNNRHTDTVQATRNLIGIIVKLPASMEHRHDHFSSRHALLVLLSGYTATIVGDRHGFIGVDHNVNLAAMSRQGLVDAVVNELKDHMVQARAIVGVADVHPGSLPHSIQALEDLNTGRVVIFCTWSLLVIV